MDQSTHTITITRIGAQCSCGGFSKVSVTGDEAARQAYKHASKYFDESTIIDTRGQDPTGELAQIKRTRRSVMRWSNFG